MKDRTEEFLVIAEAYSMLLKEYKNYSPDGFLIRINVLLSELYAKAAVLPEVNLNGDGRTDEGSENKRVTLDSRRLSKQLQKFFGEYDNFLTMYDPYEPDDGPSVASLSDALADIYGDLEAGLFLYYDGKPDEAVWEWKYSFKIHWGVHLTQVLQAVHSLLYLDQD